MNTETWNKKAYGFLESFLETSPLQKFLTEDIREWSYLKGLEKPNSERAWGGIVNGAKSAGIIKKAGYGMPTYENNPNSNPSIHARWERG